MRTVSFFGWSGSAMSEGISLAVIDQRSPDLSLANVTPAGIPSPRACSHSPVGRCEKRRVRPATGSHTGRIRALANRCLQGWPTALRQQIVPAAPSDGSPNEFANRRRLRQDDARIDIRSVPLAAGGVRLIHQKSQFAPSFFASYIVGDLLLHGHRRSIPRVLHLCRNLSRHSRCARTFFLRVFEYPQAFESGAANEIQQRLKFRICFTGKTNNESGPQRYARNSDPQFVNQIFNMRT